MSIQSTTCHLMECVHTGRPTHISFRTAKFSKYFSVNVIPWLYERDLGNGHFPMQVRLLGTHFRLNFEILSTFMLSKLNWKHTFLILDIFVNLYSWFVVYIDSSSVWFNLYLSTLSNINDFMMMMLTHTHARTHARTYTHIHVWTSHMCNIYVHNYVCVYQLNKLMITIKFNTLNHLCSWAVSVAQLRNVNCYADELNLMNSLHLTMVYDDLIYLQSRNVSWSSLERTWWYSLRSRSLSAPVISISFTSRVRQRQPDVFRSFRNPE